MANKTPDKKKHDKKPQNIPCLITVGSVVASITWSPSCPARCVVYPSSEFCFSLDTLQTNRFVFAHMYFGFPFNPCPLSLTQVLMDVCNSFLHRK